MAEEIDPLHRRETRVDPEIYDSECGRKRKYRSQDLAERAVVIMRTKNWYHKCPFVAYTCDFCGKWHIGHQSRRKVGAAIIASGTVTPEPLDHEMST